jgi:protein TonB
MQLPDRQNTLIFAIIVLAHVLALWGLNRAMQGKPIQVVVPARLMAEIVTPAPVAAVEAPSPAAPARPAPKPPPRSQPAAPTLAVADASLKPLTPIRPSPRSAPATPEAPKISPATQPTPQMPEVVVRPSSQSSDSLNPAPPYPAASRHLREAGRVVLRVLIGSDGHPQDVVLQRSSGFDRLDRISLETVRGWRFDPAAYRGRSDRQWIYIPIHFVLE